MRPVSGVNVADVGPLSLAARRRLIATIPIVPITTAALHPSITFPVSASVDADVSVTELKSDIIAPLRWVESNRSGRCMTHILPDSLFEVVRPGSAGCQGI